jgi:hypothetical protein
MKTFTTVDNGVTSSLLRQIETDQYSDWWSIFFKVWDARVGCSVRSIYGTLICGDALAIDAGSNCVLTGSWRRSDQLQVIILTDWKKNPTYCKKWCILHNPPGVNSNGTQYCAGQQYLPQVVMAWRSGITGVVSLFGVWCGLQVRTQK